MVVGVASSAASNHYCCTPACCFRALACHLRSNKGVLSRRAGTQQRSVHVCSLVLETCLASWARSEGGSRSGQTASPQTPIALARAHAHPQGDLALASLQVSVRNKPTNAVNLLLRSLCTHRGFAQNDRFVYKLAPACQLAIVQTVRRC